MRVYFLSNLDTIMRLQVQVTRVGRFEFVHGHRQTERRGLEIRRRRLRGRAGILIVQRGFLVHRHIGHL